MGFGGQRIASPGTDSYIAERMMAGLSENFAFQLCPDDGTLWFGAADPSAEASPEQTTPMVPITNSQPYYELGINSASLGSASIGLSGDAVVDTGTSVMVLSSAVVNAMISQITSASGYATIFGTQTLTGSSSDIDCLNATATPDQVDAALPPFSITLPVPATQSYFVPISGQYCFGVASVDGLPTILGDAFLRGFVTTFDVENSQFDLAPQQGC